MGYRKASPIKVPSDPAVLAYMAGLIDGEGSIGIIITKSRAGVKSHSVRLIVSNTNRKLLSWIDDHFGGTVNPAHDQRELRGWKPSYNWITTGSNADVILQAVLPYLVIKREQAKLANRLTATKSLTKNPLTPALIAKRDKMKERMHQLNQRGI